MPRDRRPAGELPRHNNAAQSGLYGTGPWNEDPKAHTPHRTAWDERPGPMHMSNTARRDDGVAMSGGIKKHDAPGEAEFPEREPGGNETGNMVHRGGEMAFSIKEITKMKPATKAAPKKRKGSGSSLYDRPAY